jgi:hypothetical protein
MTMRRLVLALVLLGSLAAEARAEPVTLINVFEVPPGALDDAVRYWVASRDFPTRQPGYVSTRLHQAMAPDARFHLVNAAKWGSAQAFAAASVRMRAEPGLVFFPALYRVSRE